MLTQIDGFILTAVSFDRDSEGHIQLFGQSNAGSFLVTINHFKNYFFVESKTPTDFRALDGHFVEKILVGSQAEQKIKRQIYEQQNLKIYESDIRILERYLMDHGLFAQVKIKGQGKMINGILTFQDPEITPGDYFPVPKIMSFDIETGKDGRLYSLAYSFRSEKLNQDEVFILGSGESTDEIKFCKDERKILELFVAATKRLDPDIITGWNVIGFDFHFLHRKSRALNCPLFLGRGKRAMDMYQNARGEWCLNLEGRVVIDGPSALKMNFFSFESYKLNNVAKILLGEGKDIDEDEVHDKWGEIERRFREDKLSLARYNLKDAQLVLDIFEKTKIIDLLLNRSLISGLLLERVGGSTAAFDHFYLPRLHDYKIVAGDVSGVNWEGQAKGGFVLNPVVGLHENVLVLDFKSLYPTIIQTFFIDPLSRFQRGLDPVMTPAGLSFSRTQNILPGKIRDLLMRRASAKKEKNAHLSQAIKILMNSFYGVMGSGGCRFYHEELPEAITGSGQWLLKSVISFLENNGLRVLYGDTDSLFVQLKSGSDIEGQGHALVKDVNLFLKEKLRAKFNVESHLEIQFDKFFKKLILTSTRGEGEGAKKRYAGLRLVESADGPKEELVLTGMEYVRSDWSPLARHFQYELIRRLFYSEDVGAYIEQTLKDLESKKLDDQLVLSKRLTRPLSEYVKNVPPHARAAKMLFEELKIFKRRPQYIMTKRGAVPIELPHSDIDYEYYIDRQLAPIADSVLSLFGQSFERYRGAQLSLF